MSMSWKFLDPGEVSGRPQFFTKALIFIPSNVLWPRAIETTKLPLLMLRLDACYEQLHQVESHQEVVHKTVNTAGQTILPMVIFNAPNLNSELINQEVQAQSTILFQMGEETQNTIH